MARFDWNRDGREDVAISHLDAPAALLTNQTATTGSYVAIHLRGVNSNRDALGTTVVLTTSGRKLTRQLTAGDGYMSSNQRVLIFPIPGEETVEEIHVGWPSGRTQVYGQVERAKEYYLVEGQRPAVRRVPLIPQLAFDRGRRPAGRRTSPAAAVLERADRFRPQNFVQYGVHAFSKLL